MEREINELDKEIQVITQVLSRIPDDDSEMPFFLNYLANAHDERFGLRQEPDDVQKVIKYRTMALTLCPDDDVGLPYLLNQIGIAHNMRFNCLGAKDDLEKAVGYGSRALSLTPDHHPHLSVYLANLAVSHKDRFQLLGELNDLEQAIKYQSRALALTSEDHPHWSSYHADMAVYYHSRFQRLGELRDLEQAIEYQSGTLALTPGNHPRLTDYLANLAVFCKDRFQRLGELSDLEQAIEYESLALSLTPDHHPHLSDYLANLAVSHKDRFERLGDLDDLERAIEYQSRALILVPDAHPKLPSRLANIAVFHGYRFQRLGELNDLEQAIEYQSRALALTPDNHPQLAGRLSHMAVSRNDRFKSLGELSDLEQAIKCEFHALDLTPNDHPQMSIRLANLAVSHNYLFERLGKLSDLGRAIEYESLALALTPDNHPGTPSRLANLAVLCKRRFQCLGVLSDLERVIQLQSRALALTPDDDPRLCMWHLNHATAYILYYEHSHDLSYLDKSLHFFTSACTSPTGSPRTMFSNARVWASCASKYSILDPIKAYQVTIDLLPQLIWLGATVDQRYQDMKMVNTLAEDAADAAIVSSKYSLALEWLEHARCVIWNQNLMLRSPLDELLAFHPDLATRLQIAADKLYTASSSSRQSHPFSSSVTSEQVAQNHRRLAKEYEELLAQSRIQPGFEDFLRPIKITGLKCAARNGPIVVINCHEDRCDALLVLPGQSTVAHLTLPNFGGKKARDAHSTMQTLLRRQGIRERGVHVRPEPGHEIDFESVLKMLWDDVVKPILEFLGYMARASTDSLPHITWCPTGAASFLPLHAAGDYDQPRSRVFDIVVSSYTPTLTALLGCTPSTLSCNSRVLAVGQAATPGRSPLPGTTTELKLVKSHLSNKAKYSELIDAQATPATVLDAMVEHDWVHLACHAHQNVHDPTKSGFFLHGGTLDLAAINQRSFKKKGLAFLSACQTATGDETLPDEAVHLASGMLMAGYSSVIATMWSVADADAPFVADKVYGQLMEKGALGNGEAGRALHDAVEGLRAKVGEKQFGRWVPFIHIGS